MSVEEWFIAKSSNVHDSTSRFESEKLTDSTVEVSFFNDSGSSNCSSSLSLERCDDSSVNVISSVVIISSLSVSDECKDIWWLESSSWSSTTDSLFESSDWAVAEKEMPSGSPSTKALSSAVIDSFSSK